MSPFEPLKWTHVLATLDFCTNKAVPIKFCDEEGHDLIIIPIKCLGYTRNGG